jgi:hypothetical protein
MTATRCPAAILFAGVVGYERPMSEHPDRYGATPPGFIALPWGRRPLIRVWTYTRASGGSAWD